MTKAKISSSFGALLAAAVIFSPNFAKSSDLLDGLNDPAPTQGVTVNWSGFYVGVHGGWAYGDWSGTPTWDQGYGPYSYPNGDSLFPSQEIEGDNWLAGLTVGANKQIDRIVLGIEADVSWGDFGGDGTFATRSAMAGKGGTEWDVEQELENLGTIRGRLGYDFGKIMVYGTGGVAFAQTSANTSAYDIASDGSRTVHMSSASVDENHIGWVAGIGAEWAFANNWSLKAEWLHIDLGEADYRFKGASTGGVPHTSDNFNSALEMDIIRAGLNYRF